MVSAKFTAAMLLGASQVLAQRPSDVSICDYYTTALLKDNTPANQYTLLTLLVNTGVIGNYTQPNVGVAVPGILAPGTYNGESVNLLPYFNGCLESTNVNNMPASVNFLDGGGAAPLMKNMPADNMNSNQYYLLTHLYQFFGKLLGCSGYGKMNFPKYGGDPGMYEVHKFMDLSAAEFGYFVQQVGLAAASFGVAKDDITAAASALQMYFGYRCSPPVDLGVGGGAVLDSICIGDKCPQDPHAMCNAYPWGGYSERPKVAPQCASMAPKPSSAPAPKPYPTSSEAPKSTEWSQWGNWGHQ